MEGGGGVVFLMACGFVFIVIGTILKRGMNFARCDNRDDLQSRG